MDAIVTLSERKDRDLKRRREAVAAAVDDLRAYALRQRGRFLIFGSAATGDIRRDSDIDILVDFPSEAAFDARLQAEVICSRRGVPSDVESLAWASPAFLERVGPHMLVLG